MPSPAGGRKLLLAAGQFPQGHGVAKVAPGNDDLIGKVQKFRQGPHAVHVFNFGKNADVCCACLL